MAMHPLQGALDELPFFVRDAQRLYGLTSGMLVKLRADRIAATGSGQGAPPAVHKTLKRSIILAAVGSWEAFVESLATAGTEHGPMDVMKDRKGWSPITGSRSLVQTPSSRNVRRLMWGLFAYDPLADWEVKVQTNEFELPDVASSNGWRGKTATHSGVDAARFLDATVSVRHILAHQDYSKKVQPIAGMAQAGAAGGANVGFHHAENAVSAVMQLAVHTTHGLARHLSLGERFRWKKRMHENVIDNPGTSDWRWWLYETPAMTRIEHSWVGYSPTA